MAQAGPSHRVVWRCGYFLRERWSPEQIAGALRNCYPDKPEKRVSHETIYNALYVMPKGELRTELLGCLRQAKRIRRPRARGEDRRGQIQDMVSLHVRPPEVEDRLIPGHWEGDLIDLPRILKAQRCCDEGSGIHARNHLNARPKDPLGYADFHSKRKSALFESDPGMTYFQQKM